MNNETINAAVQAADMMNLKLHAENLVIPVINGLNVVQSNNPQTILMANSDAFIEQLTSDGPIKDDTLESRVELVINNTKSFLTSKNVETNFMFYKDFSNGDFNFKIYVQDLIIPKDDAKNLVRNFIAYFVEPNMKDFYEFTLSYGPIIMPTEIIKNGVIDLENDEVTRSVEKMFMDLVNNLKYKNS